MKKNVGVIFVFVSLLFALYFFLHNNFKSIKVSDIVQYDNLNIQTDYLESKYGIKPQSVYGAERVYFVNGCRLEMSEDKDRNIISIGMMVNKKCDADLDSIMGLKKKLSDVTIKDLLSEDIVTGSTVWNADNSPYENFGSYDPSYGITINYGPLYSELKIYVSVDTSDDVYKKVFEMNDKLKETFGEYYDLHELLKDEDVRQFYNDEWIKSFRDAKIDYFRFGNFNR